MYITENTFSIWNGKCYGISYTVRFVVSYIDGDSSIFLIPNFMHKTQGERGKGIHINPIFNSSYTWLVLKRFLGFIPWKSVNFLPKNGLTINEQWHQLLLPSCVFVLLKVTFPVKKWLPFSYDWKQQISWLEH